MFTRFKTEKNKRSRSLTLTLSIAFLSLIAASLLISGAIGTFFSFRAQQNIVFSQQQLIAQNAANKVTGFIQEKFSALETVARLVNPAVTSRKEQDRILNHLLGPHPAFRQLILLNAKKQKSVQVSRLSRVGSNELNDKIDNDLFTQVSRGKRFVSSVYVDKVTSEPIVVMAVPVKDVFGDFRGVLIAEVNLKFMWDLVENLKIGETGLAYVVDRQGKLIAFGDIARVLRGENVGNLNEVRDFMSMADEADVEVSTGISGAKVLGTFVSLGMPDWAVVTELPVSEAYQQVFQTMVITVIFTLVMAMLAGWVGVYLAHRLAVPLVSLMQTATRIAGGELGLQAEVGGPTEISGLARAFNSMTTQLREVIDSLEQRSRYLQTTVQKYVEYMAEVGNGKLNSRIVLEEESRGTDDPLIILGRQLNETTANLQRMVEQIREVTKNLRKRESELEMYSDKLKKSNTELEQFAYIASHDLQEPLRKIRLFGDRLREKYGALLDEKAVDYLQRMNSAVIRMENFIKDLLQYSRVTSKAQPFEAVELNNIIRDVLGDLEIRINETKAEIKTQSLPTIDADPLQMRQLFQNIIGNAIKYHRANVPPVVTITSRTGANDNGNYCEINITDNGIGFDDKYVEQIFGLFQRLHGRSEYAGTGIGLAICKKIVGHHGGMISASSKKEEGSTFCITLPIKQNSSV
jgi:signal transduction histidine kinase/HAMP domain-containing protein